MRKTRKKYFWQKIAFKRKVNFYLSLVDTFFQKFFNFSFFKKHKLLFASFLMFFSFSLIVRVFADAPPGGYDTGATLTPDCLPGALLPEPCIVNVGGGSLSIGDQVTGVNSGSLLFTTGGAGVLADSSNLIWDNDLNRLTISQGITIGNISLADTISIGNPFGNPLQPVFYGGYMYVRSAIMDNIISVVDVSDPENASVVTSVVISGGSSQLVFDGDYVYAANDVGNVSVVDISDPENLSVVNTVSVGGTPLQPVISGDYMYVTNSMDGTVSVIDISTPATASVVTTVTVGSGPYQIVISGNFAYVSNSNDGTVSVVDISTPATASVVTTVAVGNQARQIVISGNYAYVASAMDNNVSVIDISTPATASVVTTVTVGSSPFKPIISGDYAYTVESSTVSVIDISTPATANVVQTINDTPSISTAPLISGNYLYITDAMSSDGIFVIDISTPASASIVNTIDFDGSLQNDLVISGDKIYITYCVMCGMDLTIFSVVDIGDPENASILAEVEISSSNPLQPVISGDYAYTTISGMGVIDIVDLTEVSNIFPANDVVALSVNGTIQSTILEGSGLVALYADSNGNIVPSFSDQALKQNVINVTGALSKVNALQGVYFNWKDAGRFGDRRELGFIAQQVESVVPEVVGTVGNYKTLNYQNLVALHNEAIKELDLKITKLSDLLQTKKVETEELCVEDVCITRDLFLEIVEDYGYSAPEIEIEEEDVEEIVEEEIVEDITEEIQEENPEEEVTNEEEQEEVIEEVAEEVQEEVVEEVI